MLVSQAMIMNSKLWRIERIPNNLLNSSPSGINFSRALCLRQMNILVNLKVFWIKLRIFFKRPEFRLYLEKSIEGSSSSGGDSCH